MKSIAALSNLDSFTVDRLLRRENVQRFGLALKIALAACCLLLAVWCIRQILTDALMTETAVSQLDHAIEERLTEMQQKPGSRQRKLPYAKLAEAQIFGQIGAVEPPARPQQAAPPVSNVALKLIGTFITDGEESTAIIEDSKKQGSQDVFGLNDSVFGEAELVAIFSDRVEIERGGKRETLVLDERVAGGGGSGAASDNTVVVDEQELDNAMANLPLLLTQARAVPYFKEGKSVGLRLFAIRRGSLFEKIGLQNGDILKEINGSSLSDISQAVKLFEKLKQQRDVSVMLERQRQEQTIRYMIR